MEKKICSECKEEKSLTEFNLHHVHVREGFSKYRGMCKACESEWKRAFYQRPENREKRKLYNKRHEKKRKLWKQKPEIKLKAREYAKEYARKYPERIRNSYWKRTFGITFQDYQDLFQKQNCKCAICGSEKPNGGPRMKNFTIDHSHKDGRVRGLLCFNCNVGLGAFKDSLDILRSAIDYLGNY